ncbi:selenouridine synthase SelU-like subunit [Methanococcus sp. CF]
MDENVLSRLITFKNDVILVIRLKTGEKVILKNGKIVSGKLTGNIASFVSESSKNILKPTVLEFSGEMFYFEPVNIKKYLESLGNELSDDVITIDQFFKLNLEDVILIDARSPREFFEKTIPTAINIPLFLTEEYETIGKLYKNEGKDVAISKAGLIIQEGIKRIVLESLKLNSDKILVVFCARGGMRSQSIATILKLLGFKVKRLVGGFKSYNLSKM